MASVVLNGSVSGSCTITAPSAAGTTTLTLPTTSGTVLTNGTNTNFPVGTILQVVSATKSDTASVSSSTFADITGLSVSITPSSASNKILIIGNINISWQLDVCKAGARIMRDSTAIAIGDVNGSRQRVTGFLYIGGTNFSPFAVPVTHLDSPATTSAITYKWQFNSLDNAGTVYVNRGFTWGNDSTVGTTISSITVMEIKG